MEGIDLSLIQNCYVGNTAAEAIYYEDTLIWPTGHNYANDYLTFEALEPTKFMFARNSSSEGNPLEYSLDNGATWTTLQPTYPGSGRPEYWTPELSTGDKILWKGNNPNPSITSNPYLGMGSFRTYGQVGQFNVSGNIMSLLYGDNFKYKYNLIVDYVFASLFNGCYTLISAEHMILPATTLSKHCYYDMFYNCNLMTTAPTILPATTLAISCYEHMFSNCVSLITAPELPATTLVNGCYASMFTSCTSLTTAPELPATTLTRSCYYNMFHQCTSLNYIKCLATNMTADYCTFNWLYSVAETGTFVKAASADWSNKTGDHGIPTGWTVQNAQ